MKVSDIIKQVRWCVDEESGYSDYEDTYFNNIVKAKIGASLRWCALYADAALLNGSDVATSTGLTTDYEVGEGDGKLPISDDMITLPLNCIRVTRVRVSSWYKGVSKFIEEDSDEYLMQSDDTGKATKDRPVAALILSNPMKVQLFPKPSSTDSIEVSLVVSPSDTSDFSSWSDSTEIAIPPKLSTAFIYYLAYLVMCAHNDNKANIMLGVAREQIAIKQ